MNEELIEKMNERVEEMEEAQVAFTSRLDAASKALAASAFKFESEELGELFGALAKAQGEIKIGKKGSVNSYYKSKYSDLEDLIKASRSALTKNGLAVVQRIILNGDRVNYLYTRLCHSSGQWMESRMALTPAKSDIQSMGSAITYVRRYAYAAMVGVATSEVDDDGEEDVLASPDVVAERAKKGISTISKGQLEVLAHELDGHEDILESLLKDYNINKLSDILSKNYTGCINNVRSIKRAKE